MSRSTQHLYLCSALCESQGEAEQLADRLGCMSALFTFHETRFPGAWMVMALGSSPIHQAHKDIMDHMSETLLKELRKEAYEAAPNPKRHITTNF